MAGLSGMKAISRYCNRSEATLLSWIRLMSFPAVKITGSWESDTGKIDQWRIDLIEKAENGYQKPSKRRIVKRK